MINNTTVTKQKKSGLEWYRWRDASANCNREGRREAKKKRDERNGRERKSRSWGALMWRKCERARMRSIPVKEARLAKLSQRVRPHRRGKRKRNCRVLDDVDCYEKRRDAKVIGRERKRERWREEKNTKKRKKKRKRVEKGRRRSEPRWRLERSMQGHEIDGKLGG